MPLQPEDEIVDNCIGYNDNIMPSRMEVVTQHCDTVPNKTKDILDTVKIEKIF